MAKIYSEQIKQRARGLRNQGFSLGEIGQKLAVPKNTISGWVRDIQLTKIQKKRIKEKEILSAAKGRVLALKTNRIKIEKWKQGIRDKVNHFKNYLSQNAEIGKLICGVLYLCEGAKYPASRYLYFGNSDPKIISFFVNALRKYYAIDENKLRFDIMYRYDQNYQELRTYWSRITSIPETKCLKSKADIRTKGRPTLKPDYRGVCRVIYYSTSLQFELQAIGEAIIKVGLTG